MAGFALTLEDLMGDCANQIFQYAAGLALARRLGVDLKLDVSWYEAAMPNPPRMYSLGLFKGVDARVVHRLCGQIIREEGFPYKPALFENAPRKCSLVGYWQCEKYGRFEPKQTDWFAFLNDNTPETGF
jgi:hypothetical protein